MYIIAYHTINEKIFFLWLDTMAPGRRSAALSIKKEEGSTLLFETVN
jgi:hypothetical protein